MRKIYLKPLFYEYKSPEIFKKMMTQKENRRISNYKRSSMEFKKRKENNSSDFFIAGLGLAVASIALISIIIIII